VIYEAADIICADNECEMSLLFCRTVAIQLVVVSLLKFHLTSLPGSPDTLRRRTLSIRSVLNRQLACLYIQNTPHADL
jgi:hypothetical protein